MPEHLSAPAKGSKLLQVGRVVDIDTGLAIEAAEFSAEKKVPLADSFIYILARHYDAPLWTQDANLEGFVGVKYQKKSGTVKESL